MNDQLSFWYFYLLGRSEINGQKSEISVLPHFSDEHEPGRTDVIDNNLTRICNTSDLELKTRSDVGLTLVIFVFTD